MELNAFTAMMRERRWNAAIELIHAQDMMALLGKVSRATNGRGIGITPADADRLRAAQATWEVYR